jgi:hypothetical protein
MRLALPPAAAVLTLIARSITKRSKGMAVCEPVKNQSEIPNRLACSMMLVQI